MAETMAAARAVLLVGRMVVGKAAWMVALSVGEKVLSTAETMAFLWAAKMAGTKVGKGAAKMVALWAGRSVVL